MGVGSVYKRCACTEPVIGDSGQALLDARGRPCRRQLGGSCPKLRRPDGTWSRKHGVWYYLLELQAIPGDGRKQIKKGGFAGHDQARDALDIIVALVAIADDADQPGLARAQIVDTIRAAHRDGRGLPTETEVRRRILLGRDVTAAVSVGDWLKEWLDGKGDIRATTNRAYASHITLYLTPHLGPIILDRLTVQHLNKMFAALDERNVRIQAANTALTKARQELAQARRTGTPKEIRAAGARLQATPKPEGRHVGPATRQRIRATLRTALSDAAAQGMLSSNVAKLVKLPSGRRPRALVWTDERVTRWQITGKKPSPVMVWTAPQTITFLTCASAHDLFALFYLVAHTGLRRGEAVGLRWSDLHLRGADGRATMLVAQQIVQIGWDTDIGAPKSDAGERVVALDPATVTVLKAHRTRQNARRLAAGPVWDEADLVFTREDGNPWHPADVTDAFTEAAADAGLPPIRLHDLRHGTATHALAAGVDIKVVQELLGHSSSTITRDTYTSVLDDAKHAAAAAISDALKGHTPKPNRTRRSAR